MKYNLTEKLNFDADPVMVIKDVEITIKSDAENVLKLMDIVQNKGEIEGALEAFQIMLSEEDMEKLKGLKLKMKDYILVLETAMDLAMGNDPDEPAGE